MSLLDDAAALAEFWDTLPIQSLVWDEMNQEARSQLGAGAHLRYDLGGTLWRGTVSLDKDEWAISKPLQGRLRAMKKIGGYFLATNPLCAAPAADPAGAILGASTVTIGSVDAETGELTLAGLPQNYAIDQGHMFHVDFGAPTRRGLFSIDSDITASTEVGETGVYETGAFTTTPVPWEGIEAGNPVTLIRPSAVFSIVAGSGRQGAIRKAIVEGSSFEILQVLDA